MQKLLNYTTLLLAFCLLATLTYSVVIKGQRDQIKIQLTSTQEQVQQLKSSNQILDETIQTLEKQNQQNRYYIRDLEKKRLATQQQSNQQIQEFKRKKNENSAINDWANKSIPSSLY